MAEKVSKPTKSKLLEVLRQRHQRGAKQDKTKTLDEFIASAGRHRKLAIRLLTTNGPLAADAPVVARRTYDEAVRRALIVLLGAADPIWGKRLKAVLARLVRRPGAIRPPPPRRHRPPARPPRGCCHQRSLVGSRPE